MASAIEATPMAICRQGDRPAGRCGTARGAGRSRLEASRLHALLDGLALHAVMRPASTPPSRIKAVIARHLDGLQAGASDA
jgi:BetI-type transcriptional repressor, C-terminal